nr:hypothetical protein [Rubripirellula lacrimiformis]
MAFLEHPSRCRLLECDRGLFGSFANRDACPIADSVDMRVDRNRINPKRKLHDNIGALASDTGQLHQLPARFRDHTIKIAKQGLAELTDVSGFEIIEAAGLDRMGDLLVA